MLFSAFGVGTGVLFGRVRRQFIDLGRHNEIILVQALDLVGVE